MCNVRVEIAKKTSHVLGNVQNIDKEKELGNSSHSMLRDKQKLQIRVYKCSSILGLTWAPQKVQNLTSGA